MRLNKKRLNFEQGFCPCCGKDFDKGGIVGYEVPGLYDGVLHWKCTKCNTYHYRFNKRPLKKKEYEELIKEELRKRGISR